MILDYQNLFSSDQEVHATAASTNVIDLGADDDAVQDNNSKGDIEILVQVTETYVGGTSVAVALQTDTDSAFGTAVTLQSTAAIAVASLVAGYQFAIIRLPRAAVSRYIRLYYTVVGSPTAGMITAGLVLDVQTNGAI